MNEPKRWLKDGAPAQYAVLFGAARSEQPSAASLKGALVAAGMVTGTAMAAGAATPASAATLVSVGGGAGKGLALVSTKLIAASLICAGTITTAALVVKLHPRASVPAPSVASVQVSARSLAASSPSLQAQSVPQAAESEPLVQAPAIPELGAKTVLPELDTKPVPPHATASVEFKQVVAPAVVQEQVTQASHSVLDEMALIDAARASLRAGQPAAALRNASAYNQAFPGGRFAPEALFLLMQANKQLGNAQAAEIAAREMVRRFPNGPHVARARELIESQGVGHFP